MIEIMVGGVVLLGTAAVLLSKNKEKQKQREKENLERIEREKIDFSKVKFNSLVNNYYKEYKEIVLAEGIKSSDLNLKGKYINLYKELDLYGIENTEAVLGFSNMLYTREIPNKILDINEMIVGFLEEIKEIKKSKMILNRVEIDKFKKKFENNYKEIEKKYDFIKSKVDKEIFGNVYSIYIKEISELHFHNFEMFSNNLSDELFQLKKSVIYLKNSFITTFSKEYMKKYRGMDFSTLKNEPRVAKLVQSIENIPQTLEGYNKEFVERELQENKDFLSNIDGKSLDNQQRDAVVIDEDNQIVIAGAGSGKTLTIAGKVSYLVKKKKVKEKEILLITFTKKASEEMKERIVEKLGINVEVSTFHSLGLRIIGEATGEKPSIVDNPDGIIQSYLDKVAFKNPEMVDKFIKFFGVYLHEYNDVNEYETKGDYYKSNKHLKFISLKGILSEEQSKKEIEEDKLKKLSEEYSFLSEDELRNLLWNKDEKITYKGEKVKSLEELMIANFLFVNGIKYEYERDYCVKTSNNKYTQYKPDFYLNDYDIYLEHFAIDKKGNTPPFFSELESKKYKDGIEWKRELHKTHKTKLIETYSYFNADGLLIEKLSKLLKEKGIKRNPISPEELVNHINILKTKSEFLEFIKILKTFLKLFKSNNYGNDQLQRFKKEASKLKNNFQKEREVLFFEIFEPLYHFYQKELKEKNHIDFDDMINLATQEAEKLDLSYKYIIIDEYQDISYSRFNLVKKIKNMTQASVMSVGDDWQSIYRFAGSDLNLFTKFEKYFGFTKELKIERTYRNSQDLIDIAGQFVMKNDKQKKKHLTSGKRTKKPVLIMEYVSNKETALMEAIDNILEKNPKKRVMLLGRNNFDIEFLKESQYFIVEKKDEGIKVTSHLHPETEIIFMTIHKSKGLEADEVIIINNENELLGFPNKISDDTVMRHVLVDPDDFPFGEERRLFYVALTRTKGRCILLSPFGKSSCFVDELKKEGIESIELENVQTVKCPSCQTGNLVLKEGKAKKTKFLACDNYPQCDFITGKVEILNSPIQCPWCGGYMLPKEGKYGKFFGCMNYPDCTNTQKMIEN